MGRVFFVWVHEWWPFFMCCVIADILRDIARAIRERPR